ncbi:MAG: sugar transferase [Lachnospiraceae bacterium]
MSQEYIRTVEERETSVYQRKERQREKRRVYAAVKRTFDIVISAIGLIVLSPLFVLLSICVYLSDPGKIFYAHERLGQGGKPIRIWKFRSMYKNADEMFENFTKEQKEEYYREFKLKDDPRITPVGKFLRKSSLDELPQLVNILMGDLSLVGPRPIVKEELEKYGMQDKRFLSVKPGLTGYWQANGRNRISYENGRQEMELYYINHQSLWLDIKIIFKTFAAVLKKDGAQ